MTSIVRRIWQLPGAPGAPRRVWRDWLLVGIVALLAILEAVLRTGQAWLWPSLVVEAILIVALFWRRTHPGLAVVAVFGSSAILDAARLVAGLPPADVYSSVFVLFVLYALTRWGSGRALVLGGVVIILGLVRPFMLNGIEPAEVIGGLAVVAIPLTIGAVIRYRDVVRTERLEQVRVHERERIARDLHDTVAHHVTAIALRAQAGIALADDPAAADAALQAIQTEASVTLREMRSLVGVLRDEGDLRRPRPTADDLRALGASSHGARFTLTLEGDLDTLPAPTIAALYRIVQEAVTNARRHAVDATVIEAAVLVSAEVVTVRIHDDGQGATRRVDGFGIRGMVERADLLGGACSAAPDENGGWTVSASLPIAAGAR